MAKLVWTKIRKSRIFSIYSCRRTMLSCTKNIDRRRGRASVKPQFTLFCPHCNWSLFTLPSEEKGWSVVVMLLPNPAQKKAKMPKSAAIPAKSGLRKMKRGGNGVFFLKVLLCGGEICPTSIFAAFVNIKKNAPQAPNHFPLWWDHEKIHAEVPPYLCCSSAGTSRTAVLYCGGDKKRG